MRWGRFIAPLPQDSPGRRFSNPAAFPFSLPDFQEAVSLRTSTHHDSRSVAPRLHRGPGGLPRGLGGADSHRLHRTYRVTIDVSRAHFWDITAMSSLDRAVIKFRREGARVEIVGLNEASSTMVDRYAIHDKPDAAEQLPAH